MDKRSSSRITRAVRAQIDPVNSHAQKAENSAFLAQQLQENFTIAIGLPELAAAVGGQYESMRNAFYLHPDRFPPAIYLPGCRGPRFLVEDVRAWLEARKTQTTPPPAATPKPQGRPRKASQAQITLARQGKGGAA